MNRHLGPGFGQVRRHGAAPQLVLITFHSLTRGTKPPDCIRSASACTPGRAGRRGYPLALPLLLTPVKEMVYDPAFLGQEAEALLQRLIQTDQTKWEALRQLGLDWGGEFR